MCVPPRVAACNLGTDLLDEIDRGLLTTHSLQALPGVFVATEPSHHTVFIVTLTGLLSPGNQLSVDKVLVSDHFVEGYMELDNWLFNVFPGDTNVNVDFREI